MFICSGDWRSVNNLIGFVCCCVSCHTTLLRWRPYVSRDCVAPSECDIWKTAAALGALMVASVKAFENVGGSLELAEHVMDSWRCEHLNRRWPHPSKARTQYRVGVSRKGTRMSSRPQSGSEWNSGRIRLPTLSCPKNLFEYMQTSLRNSLGQHSGATQHS